MNCPHCGSNLAVKGKFCAHCGSPIPEDVYIRIEEKKEIIDHGRVADAQARQTIIKETTKQGRGKVLIKIVIILVLGLLAYYFISILDGQFQREFKLREAASTTEAPLSYQVDHLFEDERNQHKSEVERLTKLEEEILEDIRNQRYDEALTKTSLLYYTNGNWSKDTEKTWDKKREDLIERLNGLLGNTR